MANTKIWDLPLVSSPNGTERIPVATGASSGNNGYLDLNALGSAPKQLTSRVASNGTQTINLDGTIQTLNTLWTVGWNYGNLWDNVNKKFTAPVSGLWHVSCFVQVDRVTGTGDGEVHLNVNLMANGGSGNRLNDVSARVSSGDRWFLHVGGQLPINAGESIYALMLATGFIGTGTVSNSNWDIHLVHRL